MAIVRTGVSSAMTSSAATVSVPFPTGCAAGDTALLLIETANEGLGANPAALGWTVLTGSTATATGTAAAAGATRLAVCWKVLTSGDITTGSVSISDTGDHQNAVIITYSGVDATTPFTWLSGSGDVGTPATTSVSLSAVSRASASSVALGIIATDRDNATASTNTAASWTGVGAPASNSFIVNFSSLTNAGGGLIVNEGTGGAAGSAAFSCSITSSIWVGRIVVVNPAGVTVGLTGQSLSVAQGSVVSTPPANTYAIVDHANTTTSHVGGGVYQITKVSGGSAYNASAVSTAAVTGDFVLRLEQITGGGSFAGLSASPLVDDSTTIDYSWQLFGTFTIYEGGVAQSSALSGGTYAWIWRTGTTLGYGRGATLAAAQVTPDRTVTTSAALYFDSSVFFNGDVVGAKLCFPNLSGQSVVAAQGSTAASTTVALTGQSLTASRGSLAPAVSMAITGQSAAVACGSVVAAPSLALSGQGLTAARGTVTVATTDVTVALTGQSLTAARGSVVGGSALAATGQSVAAARGTLAPTASMAITGQSSTVARGTVAPTASLAVSGQAVAVSRGSLLAATSMTLAGQSLTAARGSMSPASAFALTGVSTVASRGTIAPTLDATLAGRSLIAGQGDTASTTTFALVGAGVTATSGSVIVVTNNVTVALTGQSLAASQGLLTALFTPAWLTSPAPDAVTLTPFDDPDAIVLTTDATPSATPLAVSPSPAAGTFTQDNDPGQLEWSA